MTSANAAAPSVIPKELALRPKVDCQCGLNCRVIAAVRTLRLIGGCTDESAMVAMQVRRVRQHGDSIGKTDDGGNIQKDGSGGDRDNVKEVAEICKSVERDDRVESAV